MTPAGRQRLLLAELEDPLALSLLAKLYEHNDSYDVLLSRTADVTRALLLGERFHVLVTPARPSEPSAIARLAGELNVGTPRIVALVDGEVGEDAASLYASGADSVRQITTAVSELADEIVRVARADTVLEGRLDQVGAPELIQMLCLCRRSLMLRVEADGERAAVWLVNGEVHHAVSDARSGQQAMSRIVRAESGSFRAISASAPPRRTIHQDWQHVMLDAAREGDEAQHAAARSAAARSAAAHSAAPPAARANCHQEGGLVASEPPPAQSQVRKLEKTYRELTELGLQSIKARDFSKAREYWAAARAIGPDRPPPAAAGLIQPAPNQPPKRAERR